MTGARQAATLFCNAGVWLFLGLAILLEGCAVMHPGPDNWEGSIITKPATGVIVGHFSKKGIIITGSDPTANGLPSIQFGTLEVDFGVVPTSANSPKVRINSEVDATTGIHTGDTLEIGPPPKVP